MKLSYQEEILAFGSPYCLPAGLPTQSLVGSTIEKNIQFSTLAKLLV
jgi:hypothetical protein